MVVTVAVWLLRCSHALPHTFFACGCACTFALPRHTGYLRLDCRFGWFTLRSTRVLDCRITYTVVPSYTGSVTVHVYYRLFYRSAFVVCWLRCQFYGCHPPWIARLRLRFYVYTWLHLHRCYLPHAVGLLHDTTPLRLFAVYRTHTLRLRLLLPRRRLPHTFHTFWLPHLPYRVLVPVYCTHYRSTTTHVAWLRTHLLGSVTHAVLVTFVAALHALVTARAVPFPFTTHVHCTHRVLGWIAALPLRLPHYVTGLVLVTLPFGLRTRSLPHALGSLPLLPHTCRITAVVHTRLRFTAVTTRTLPVLCTDWFVNASSAVYRLLLRCRSCRFAAVFGSFTVHHADPAYHTRFATHTHAFYHTHSAFAFTTRRTVCYTFTFTVAGSFTPGYTRFTFGCVTPIAVVYVLVLRLPYHYPVDFAVLCRALRLHRFTAYGLLLPFVWTYVAVTRLPHAFTRRFTHFFCRLRTVAHTVTVAVRCSLRLHAVLILRLCNLRF